MLKWAREMTFLRSAAQDKSKTGPQAEQFSELDLPYAEST
jgi:hypothetical protein